MKTKKVKTLDGDTITRYIPENEADRQKLLDENGAEAGRHSFADGRIEPPDVDKMKEDPDLGDVTSQKGS